MRTKFYAFLPHDIRSTDLSFKTPSPKGEGWDEGSYFIQVSLISTYRVLGYPLNVGQASGNWT